MKMRVRHGLRGFTSGACGGHSGLGRVASFKCRPAGAICCLTPGSLGHRFPLHYPVLSTGNIFVDHGFNISCNIDWALPHNHSLSLLTLPLLHL